MPTTPTHVLHVACKLARRRNQATDRHGGRGASTGNESCSTDGRNNKSYLECTHWKVPPHLVGSRIEIAYAIWMQTTPSLSSITDLTLSDAVSGLAIHQAPQTCFDTAATDERGADLVCISERSSRPVF
jgi:hypothetical protein